MPVTYKKIASVTVGSGGAASIDITSIPADYDDLVLKISSRINSTGDVWKDASVRFNGSTTGFTARLLYGTGSAVGSNNGAADNFWTSSNSATSNTFGNGEIYIPNYAGNTNKSVSVDSVSEHNGTAALAAMTAVLWSNTAAINRITLTPASAASFMQYSTATLYGISKS